MTSERISRKNAAKAKTNLNRLIQLFLPHFTALFPDSRTNLGRQKLTDDEARSFLKYFLTLRDGGDQSGDEWMTLPDFLAAQQTLKDERARTEDRFPESTEDYEACVTAAQNTFCQILVWFHLLHSAMADDHTPDVLDWVDEDTMFPKDLMGGISQFFSLPHLGGWDNVSPLFRRVRASLPADKHLPDEVVALLRQLEKN